MVERRVDHEGRQVTAEIARQEVIKALAEVNATPPEVRALKPKVLVLGIVAAVLFAASVMLANVALYTTLQSAADQIVQLDQRVADLRAEIIVLRDQVVRLGGEPAGRP